MFSSLIHQVRITSPFRMRNDLHLVRKAWHMATGLLGLAVYYNSSLSIESIAVALLVFSLAAFIVEFVRLRNDKINMVLMSVMKPFMRESEKTSVSGLPFYALGSGLTLLIFPEKIAILSVLFLIFADPIASVFGILYGKDKILPNKSLQGTLAAFTVCYVIAMVYGMRFSNPNMNLLCFSLLAGMIGSISELCSRYVDDNLSIPVISGTGLYLVNHYWIHVF